MDKETRRSYETKRRARKKDRTLDRTSDSLDKCEDVGLYSTVLVW